MFSIKRLSMGYDDFFILLFKAASLTFPARGVLPSSCSSFPGIVGKSREYVLNHIEKEVKNVKLFITVGSKFSKVDLRKVIFP
jgi:hypothetical protein